MARTMIVIGKDVGWTEEHRALCRTVADLLPDDLVLDINDYTNRAQRAGLSEGVLRSAFALGGRRGLLELLFFSEVT